MAEPIRTANEQAWRQRLDASFEMIKGWSERPKRVEEAPPGSLLARDDADLRGHVQSGAWYGIVTAIDHLNLLTDTFGSEQGVQLRPSSPFTVTRGALLGASQTVWMLAPNTRRIRHRNALLVAHDEKVQHLAFLEDYAKDSFVQAQVQPEFFNELEVMVKKLKAEKERLARDLKAIGTPNARFSSTVVIKEAAEHLLRTSPGADEWLRVVFPYEWRMASAAAHARQWVLHVRPTETATRSEGSIRYTSTSIQELAQSVGAAVLMTKEALRLWDVHRVVEGATVPTEGP